MRSPLRCTAALGLCALLAACATAPPEPLPEPVIEAPLSEAQRWDQHRSSVAALGRWDARGKVAYRLPDDAGSASMLWQRADGDSTLRLSGPLGANAVRLRSDGALIHLTRDGIERSYPADAAPWLGDGRLLPIPVQALDHWLRGIPDPELELELLETGEGLAQRLVQAGWEVRYERYAREGALTLPSALTVYAGPAELRLRVLIRDWDVEAE